MAWNYFLRNGLPTLSIFHQEVNVFIYFIHLNISQISDDEFSLNKIIYQIKNYEIPKWMIVAK